MADSMREKELRRTPAQIGRNLSPTKLDIY
jgi:hypothetical protein